MRVQNDEPELHSGRLDFESVMAGLLKFPCNGEMPSSQIADPRSTCFHFQVLVASASCNVMFKTANCRRMLAIGNSRS